MKKPLVVSALLAILAACSGTGVDPLVHLECDPGRIHVSVDASGDAALDSITYENCVNIETGEPYDL